MALGSAATALWARQALGRTLLFEKRYDAMVSEGRAFLAEHPSGEDAELTLRFVCAARALGHIAGPDPAPAPAAGRPRGKVEAPRPIFRQPPGYTDTALAAAVRGAVVAEAVVDQEGCIADATIVTGLAGDLDLAVLDALRFWTFHPATLEGRPVVACGLAPP
jgi:outer membrane biosynthesis protein TonB